MITIPAEYTCAICGETNSTFVDPSQGDHQSYVEDCQVCCRPNQLNVTGTYPDYQIEAQAE